MVLELSSEDIRVLVKIIERELLELNPEIRHSATQWMRGELREERDVLRLLLSELRALDIRGGVSVSDHPTWSAWKPGIHGGSSKTAL